MTRPIRMYETRARFHAKHTKKRNVRILYHRPHTKAMRLNFQVYTNYGPLNHRKLTSVVHSRCIRSQAFVASQSAVRPRIPNMPISAFALARERYRPRSLHGRVARLGHVRVCVVSKTRCVPRLRVAL